MVLFLVIVQSFLVNVATYPMSHRLLIEIKFSAINGL
jgi:hypothetical protein